MEICTEVNIIPLNTIFLCYNVIDKASLVMSKNIETVFTKWLVKKFRQINYLEIMKSLYYGGQWDQFAQISKKTSS